MEWSLEARVSTFACFDVSCHLLTMKLNFLYQFQCYDQSIRLGKGGVGLIFRVKEDQIFSWPKDKIETKLRRVRATLASSLSTIRM